MHGEQGRDTVEARSVTHTRGHRDHWLSRQSTDHTRQRTFHPGDHDDHIGGHHVVESRQETVQAGHSDVGDALCFDPVGSQRQDALVDDGNISGAGGDHEQAPGVPRGRRTPQHRRVSDQSFSVRGLESLALVIAHPRDEYGSGSVLEQFADDAHALFGRLARRVHRLGSTLAQMSMVIDEGISYVGEGQT